MRTEMGSGQTVSRPCPWVVMLFAHSKRKSVRNTRSRVGHRFKKHHDLSLRFPAFRPAFRPRLQLNPWGRAIAPSVRDQMLAPTLDFGPWTRNMNPETRNLKPAASAHVARQLAP